MYDIALLPLLSSVIYSVLGFVLMVVAVMTTNHVFKLDLRKEILTDHNTSAGIVIAGIMISVGIIVASAIK